MPTALIPLARCGRSARTLGSGDAEYQPSTPVPRSPPGPAAREALPGGAAGGQASPGAGTSGPARCPRPSETAMPASTIRSSGKAAMVLPTDAGGGGLIRLNR
jgi:hypothetical protein